MIHHLLAASGHMPPGTARFLGWAVVIAVIAVVAGLVLKVLGIFR